MRVVLDTNTAVSGLLWGGVPGQLIDAAQWFPVVIRRALAAREQGFPAEPIPDGQFRSRSKQFRRSRKEYRSVP